MQLAGKRSQVTFLYDFFDELQRRVPVSGGRGDHRRWNVRSSLSNNANPLFAEPEEDNARNRVSASNCASATVASSSISLFMLMPRLSARRLSLSCFDSGIRIVKVLMVTPSTVPPDSVSESPENEVPLSGSRGCCSLRSSWLLRQSPIPSNDCLLRQGGWGARSNKSAPIGSLRARLPIAPCAPHRKEANSGTASPGPGHPRIREKEFVQPMGSTYPPNRPELCAGSCRPVARARRPGRLCR